jgi:hypothetical protein
MLVASGAAIGLVAGVALAFATDAFGDAGIRDIAPFSVPSEMCSFNTFETSAAADVPAMVSSCDYLFDKRQYVSVGYRI